MHRNMWSHQYFDRHISWRIRSPKFGVSALFRAITCSFEAVPGEYLSRTQLLRNKRVLVSKHILQLNYETMARCMMDI